MANFYYRAKRGGAAKVEDGQIEAESRLEANKKLREQGLLVLSVAERAKSRGFSLGQFGKSVPLKEKIIFTRQLSVMVRAGLSIVKALEALKKQTENKYFQEVIEGLIVHVKGGQTLSQVMHHYPRIFPEIYTAVIKAGEETGQLADVLLNLASQQEKDADLISKIKSAMIYPAIILLSLIGVVFLIVFFVLPSLQAIFADSGQKLPFLTRMLLGSSNIIRHYFLFVAAFLVGLFFFLRFWFKKPAGRHFYDTLKIRAPIFGNLTRKVYMARFSRTMAMLTKASLPIIQSIKIVRKTINNSLYDAAFMRIEHSVESGRPLSVSLNKEVLFPPMVGQLTSLGEESGNLENVLLEVATFYDKEVDTISRNLSTLLEPLLLIFMGLGVGLVVAAVLQPIYGLVGTIS